MSVETMAADISSETAQALSAVDAALSVNQLSAGAAQNLRRWLTESGYAAYVPKIVPLIDAGKWVELEGLFWEVIPFGTGGRRGLMAEFGSATMNERTVAES